MIRRRWGELLEWVTKMRGMCHRGGAYRTVVRLHWILPMRRPSSPSPCSCSYCSCSDVPAADPIVLSQSRSLTRQREIAPAIRKRVRLPFGGPHKRQRIFFVVVVRVEREVDNVRYSSSLPLLRTPRTRILALIIIAPRLPVHRYLALHPALIRILVRIQHENFRLRMVLVPTPVVPRWSRSRSRRRRFGLGWRQRLHFGRRRRRSRFPSRRMIAPVGGMPFAVGFDDDVLCALRRLLQDIIEITDPPRGIRTVHCISALKAGSETHPSTYKSSTLRVCSHTGQSHVVVCSMTLYQLSASKHCACTQVIERHGTLIRV